MGVVRIGILDKDTDYVSRLSVYLNRMGRGKWNMNAFTDKQALVEYMEKRGLDVLMVTKEQELEELQKQYAKTSYIWLSEEKKANPGLKEKEENSYAIYRYQSAGEIGKELADRIKQMGILERASKKMIAVYSPVGRCGKTSLILKLVKEKRCGNWLYIGMEDYSTFTWETKREKKENEEAREGSRTQQTENFLYYIKEREEAELQQLVQEREGIIPAAFSPFDTKQMEKEDIKWLLNILQKNTRYDGAIFDIGTGILQDMELLFLFDYLLIPYLNEKNAMIKKENFKSLLEAYEHGRKEEIHFLNMEEETEAVKQAEALFNGMQC